MLFSLLIEQRSHVCCCRAAQVTVVLEIPDTTPCYRPPTRQHADVSLHQDHNGVVAIYTCHTGYQFAAGGTTRTVLCQATEWSHDIPDCERTCALRPPSVAHIVTQFTSRF